MATDDIRTPLDDAVAGIPGAFRATKGYLTDAYNSLSRDAPQFTYWATAGLAFFLSYKVLDVVRERMGWNTGIFGTISFLAALGGAFWMAKEGGKAQLRHSNELIAGAAPQGEEDPQTTSKVFENAANGATPATASTPDPNTPNPARPAPNVSGMTV